MSADDLYQRPSREKIAARFETPDPPRIVRGIVESAEPASSPLANFAVHLSARMRALGWDQAQLQEKAGITAHIAARAVNGTACDLALAGSIAELVGGYLATMIGPYACSTCGGEPPRGFCCLECGAKAVAQ